MRYLASFLVQSISRQIAFVATTMQSCTVSSNNKNGLSRITKTITFEFIKDVRVTFFLKDMKCH